MERDCVDRATLAIFALCRHELTKMAVATEPISTLLKSAPGELEAMQQYIVKGALAGSACSIVRGAQRIFDMLRQNHPAHPRLTQAADRATRDNIAWLNAFRLKAERLPGIELAQATEAGQRAVTLVTQVQQDLDRLQQR